MIKENWFKVGLIFTLVYFVLTVVFSFIALGIWFLDILPGLQVFLPVAFISGVMVGLLYEKNNTFSKILASVLFILAVLHIMNSTINSCFGVCA